MSQLRKSATFRSRIPVRRNRFCLNHCPSTVDDSTHIFGCASYNKLITKRSFVSKGVHHRINNDKHFRNHRTPQDCTCHTRNLCTSSSFSSSDESCESEAPHQKFARQVQKDAPKNSIYISTDALSLDGLLDSVSCGSFSGPPSPVLYQNTKQQSYESLDSILPQIEKSLNNKTNNNKYFSRNIYQEQHITPYNNLWAPCPILPFEPKKTLNSMAFKSSAVDNVSTDNASKKSMYMEKQKQLSDWYYIKTKRDDIVLQGENKSEANIIASSETAHVDDNVSGLKTVPNKSMLSEHNYVNTTRQLQLESDNNPCHPMPAATQFTALARTVVEGNASYAAISKLSSNMNIHTRKQQNTRWNTFDQPQYQEVSSVYTVQKEDGVDDSDIHEFVEYNEALDAIAESQSKPKCPPYYCPPNYATPQSYANELNRCTSDHPAVFGDNAGLSIGHVNVRLLKQHYQQLPPCAPPSAAEYANMSFRRRDESGKRNKIELQLEHWENIGNNNNIRGVDAAAKCNRAPLDITNSSRSSSKHSIIPPSNGSSTKTDKQHPQRHPFNNRICCSNDDNSATVIATFSNNTHIRHSNSNSSCSSNNINKHHNNGSNILCQQLQQKEHQEEQQEEQPLTYDTSTTHTHQQHLQHRNMSAHRLENTMQQHQPFSQQHSLSQQQSLGCQTASSSQLTPTPTATPRAAQRSRTVQKRSDETSCSSFEQLNIVGIPMPDDVGEYDNDRHDYDVGINTCRDEKAVYSNRHLIDHQNATLQLTDTFNETYDTNAAIDSNICLEISEERSSQLDSTKTTLPESQLNSTLPNITNQKQQQIQLQLQQNPRTRQLYGVLDGEMFPPKIASSCRSDCELSGSYASLECPSPPGPPVSLPESRRDPQARLSSYLRTYYTDLSLKEPIIPQWAIPVAPGELCAARLEPDLRLNSILHGFSDSLTVDQILVSVQTKEGSFLDAPRRCLIECPAWASRSNLCLRILHAWAKEPPWPTKGTPVALALFIPLAEVKRSFASYVEKELLPKGPLNPFSNGTGGFSTAWNSLGALGPKLLIILDGYDGQRLGNPSNSGGTPKKSKSNTSIGGGNCKNHYPMDVHDLLDGKLFPECRVIITTSMISCPELHPIIHRHILYDGLTWGRSVSLLGGGQWAGPSILLDSIQENLYLRKVIRTPLGCLAITSIYESSGGDLPSDELDVVESILNCVSPETSAINVSELGRLALFCLKMKRPNFTLAEMRMYCSIPESSLLGCLDRNILFGKSAKKKCEYVYSPICPGMMEFLAANYITSLASRPGLLAAEITGMAVADELDIDLLKVLKFSMTLLGERAHILLSRLTPLWLTPQIVFTLSLAGGHTDGNMAALCDILGISKHPPISPLETKPLWVQVRSVPTDLMGWGMALKSNTCTLKNLEVIYQLEKHNVQESRKAIEIFLDSIILNESVSTLRLTSLIEMDVKDSEISYLANCISKLLLKPRLENFELVLTLLEEEPPILKLQSVVASLCRTIPRQPRLSFLLLDLSLSTSQLVQICTTLEKCSNVTRLSFPHLRCERGAITALASLLNSRPISFLSLPSCWGARDDPPSSSGVSMGSGSGSSTGTSGIIKQGSLPGVPSPRSYAPGVFSSLPRGVFVPQSSLGRSATLPRQPLEQSLDKRSCDSVVSKTWYPTPACDGGPHNSGTLHDLLFAARDSYSKLHGLDLSKAQLSLEDSMCLGETVRISNTLHTLKLEGSSRLTEILPSILGASESSCLQMLSIGSPRLCLEDSAIAMCARALTSSSTLRLLSLDGWSFRLENSATLSILRAFLSLTCVRELSLANCRLQIGFLKTETKISRAFESRSVVVLKLAGAQATLADAAIMRGPQLLQYIGGFPCLRELDLSAPARSGLGNAHTTPLILDDKCIISFFQNLHSHFGLLNTLKICNWVIHFDEMSKTLKAISKCMRNSPISHLKVDGITVLDRPKKQRIDSNLVHSFISSLPQLRWMGISLAGKNEEHITAIGNAVLDLKGYEIDIKLSESTIEHAKLMAQAISIDGKFDIKVSTFGTSSGILVHAEKSGTKSLTRKNQD